MRSTACAQYYTGLGSDISCQGNGQWTQASGCSTITCPDPFPPTGYSVSVGANTWNSDRDVQCLLGYVGSPPKITCQASGAWTGFSGCTALACPVLTVTNSDALSVAGSTGDTYTVTCIAGFSSANSAQRSFVATCAGVTAEAAAWQDVTTCVRNQCAPFDNFGAGVIGSSSNGCVLGIVLSAGSSCQVECGSGYASQTSTVACAFDANPNDAAAYSPTLICNEAACSAITFPAGVEGFGTSNACFSGQVLTTRSDQDCEVRCSEGGSSPQTSTVYCDFSANSNDPVNGFPSCNQNTCGGFYFGVGVVGGDSDPCTNGIALTTRSDPTCNLKCDAQYEANTATLSCPYSAWEGDLPIGNLQCTPKWIAVSSTSAPFSGVACSSAGASSAIIAVANDGRVFRSVDGVIWSEVILPGSIGSNSWQDVTFGAGLFVAVASAGPNRVITSADGSTWTARSAPSSDWAAVTYNADKAMFVAVAGSGSSLAMFSSDGISWTASASMPTAVYSDVVGANVDDGTGSPGLFVAVTHGSGSFATSRDGNTWTSHVNPDSSTSGFTSVFFSLSPTNNAPFFVAVADSGSQLVMTSVDGFTWSNWDSSAANAWKSVAASSSMYVAVAASGTERVMTSISGKSWTSVASSDAANGGWEEVIWFPSASKFVAVGSSGTNRIMYRTAE